MAKIYHSVITHDGPDSEDYVCRSEEVSACPDLALAREIMKHDPFFWFHDNDLTVWPNMLL